MANKEKNWKDNAEGPWYVDDLCILCGLCVDLAPLHFKESNSGDHMIVFKQPRNQNEAQECEKAMQQCPVESIGNDRG